MGVLYADCNSNKSSFWGVTLFYGTTANNFLNGLWCAMKSGFYTVSRNGQLVVALRRRFKHFPKPNIHQKRSWSLFSLVHSDTPHLSESWWNHHIWDVCSADWWGAWKTAMSSANIGQQEGPNSSPRQRPTACGTTNASKVEWIGL